MAANILNYMQQTLGMPFDVAQALVDEGGFQDFQDLVTFKDDRIQDIIKVCRKLPDPAAVVVGAGGGGGGASRGGGGGRGGAGRGAGAAAVAAPAGAGGDRRLRVSDLASVRMRQLAYYCWHMHRIDRPFVEAEATLERLNDLWEWRNEELEDAKREVKEPEPMVKEGTTRKTLDELDNYLQTQRGQNGTPLAYLTRQNVEPVAAEDRGYGQPSITDDLIARARHTGYAYTKDNKFLWGVISRMTRGGFAWTWVKDQQRDQDGRQAYMQLRLRYLGPSNRSLIKAEADKVVATTYYDGKARNFTLEDYCVKLKQAFIDLEECGEPASESKKVRAFIAGLHAPEMAVAKGYILGTDRLLEDLDAAMNYARTWYHQERSVKSQNRNISSMESGGRGRGRGGRGGKGGRGGGGRGNGSSNSKSKRKEKAKTAYVPLDKWNELSQEERQAIRDAREASKAKRKNAEVSTDSSEKDSKKSKSSDTEVVGVGNSMSRKGS
jgi:hypothetical protein